MAGEQRSPTPEAPAGDREEERVAVSGLLNFLVENFGVAAATELDEDPQCTSQTGNAEGNSVSREQAVNIIQETDLTFGEQYRTMEYINGSQGQSHS